MSGLVPSSNSASRSDATVPTNYGEKNRMGELGVVVNYQTDKYTATVRTERGKVLQGVVRKRYSPVDTSTLAPGTEVLVSYAYGFPMIDGVVSMPAQERD